MRYTRASERLSAADWTPRLDNPVFSASIGYKYYDAMPADGVGDLKPINIPTALLLTPDTIADDTSTTSTLTVDAPSIVSTIDTIGDQDFFRVDLVAGQTYEIAQYLVTGGPSGVPLNDAYLEIYDAAGNLITSADGGGPNTRPASTRC